MLRRGRLVLLCVLLLGGLLGPRSLQAQVPNASFAEIAQKSDLIFVGTLQEQSSQFNENRTLIYTTATFAHPRVLHAEGAAQADDETIEVVYAGGEVDSLGFRVGGQPHFEQDRRYLILKRDDGERYFNPIMGRDRGLFRILRDSETGTPYVLSSAGHAVLRATPEQVITSDQAVRAIQNGDVLWAEDTTESFQHSTLPTPDTSDGAVQRHPPDHPSRGTPMTLGEFASFLQETALTATVEDPRLRLGGTGRLYRRVEGALRKESLPDAKAFAQNSSTTQVQTKAQNLRACGHQDLKITMEHYAPFKVRDKEAMGIWNRFMEIYNTDPDDGSFDRNQENEFIGTASQSRMRSAYNGFSWNGALAITKLWYFSLKQCPEFGESDVALNSAYNWTNDFSTAIDTANVYSYRAVMMHELGHTWGHQDMINEQYNYDEPSVMHAGWDQWLVEVGWGIHAPDAHYLRKTYNGKTSVKNIQDVGVESYYADEGLNLARARKAGASKPYSCGKKKRCAFRPGEKMDVNGLTVENMSNSDQQVLLRLYLSKDRTITSADHQLASYSWSSFSAESFQENDYTVTVPFSMRDNPGAYYVGVRVLIPGTGQPDDFTRNNATFLYKKIDVKKPLTVSGTIAQSGSGIKGVTMERIPKGAASASGTATTDKNGDYTLDVPYKFVGTVDPVSRVFTFSPTDSTFAGVTGAQKNVDFAATRQTAKISGTVTDASTGAAIPNVSIPGLPGPPTTNSQGYYEVTVDEGFSYSFAASKAGRSFTPSSYTISRLTGDVTRDFTGRAAYVADGPWPQFQYNRGRAGERSGIGVIQTGKVLKGEVNATVSGNPNAEVFSSPAVGPLGRVYVGSQDSYVYAFKKDMTRAWRYKTGGKVWSSPAIGTGGRIYVGASDGKLYALNRDGTLAWTFQTQGPVHAAPVIGYNGTIYVGSLDDSLYAVRPNGTKKWAYGTGGDVATPALGPDSNRVYVGSGDGALYALSTSGAKQWSFSAGNKISAAPAVARDGNVYVGAENGTLYALRPDGSTRWTYSTGGPIRSSPALGRKQRIYVGSDDDLLHAVDSSGIQRWTFTMGDDVRSSPAVQTYSDPSGNFYGEIVYVGSLDGRLYAVQGTSSNFASKGSQVWSYKTSRAGLVGRVYSSPALTKNRVFVGAIGTLYSLGNPVPGGGGTGGGRSAQLQAVVAGMTPSPEDLYVVNRVARNALETVDRFGESGWGSGGCSGGPLIIPACGIGGRARYGGATSYRDLVGGGLYRVGALASWVPLEQGSLQRILSGETTAGLLGSFVRRFEPGTNYLAVLAGFSDPSQYPENPNGRSTALNLFVKEGALAESPAPNMVQVMAGHFVPDAPQMEISIQGIEESLGTLKYGDMTDYRALSPGRYVVVLRIGTSASPAAGGIERKAESRQRTFRLDLTGKAGETVALLANGSLQATDEPPVSIRAVGSDGELSDLRALEGTLAPGLSAVPGLLEDDLLLAPGESRQVSFEPQFRTAGVSGGRGAVRQLTPFLTSSVGHVRTPNPVDLPASYELPGAALSFTFDNAPTVRTRMTGQPLSEMPAPMAELIESRDRLRATHLGVLEASRSGGSFRFWLAMRTINGYAVPVASLLQVDGVDGGESASAILAGYLPRTMRLHRAPLSDVPFEIEIGVDLRVQSSAGSSFRRVTELPVLMGAEGQHLSVGRTALGQPGGETAYLKDPIHLRLDSLIYGIDGQRRPVRDCTYVALNRGNAASQTLSKSRVSARPELAAIWSGTTTEEDGLAVEQGRVYAVGRAERTGLVSSVSSVVESGGRVSFGQTGVDIQFSGMQGSGTVTVQKYGNAPNSTVGISAPTVGSYRWLIESGDNLSVGPETKVRLDIRSLVGIDAPKEVTLYQRPDTSGSRWNPVPTSYDAGTKELVATTGGFSEFALASRSAANLLPLELSSFKAAPTDDAAIRLTWEVPSTTGDAGFVIQRRAEIPSQWRRIGFVESKTGESSGSVAYEFRDPSLPYAADSLSYRLRQTASDGTMRYSQVRTVDRTVDEVRLLGTYPNPAQRQATLHYALPERTAVTIYLYDVLGRQVQTVVDGKRQGRQSVDLDVSGLSSGVYFLQLRTDGATRTQRVTVVR